VSSFVAPPMEQPAVLIVDDQPDPYLLSERQLQEVGAQRKSVTSLEAAAGVLRHWHSDVVQRRAVVVLDLMFPTDPEDGLTFLRAVMQRELPVPRHTYVIVRTGVYRDEIKKRAYALGALEYVGKVEGPEVLMTAVKFACGEDVRTARTLCQVFEVDAERGTVRVRIEGHGGWYAERSFELSWCPVEARVPGGSFYAETYKRLTGSGAEIVLKSAAVDAAAEADVLAHLFRPL
jgi:CheY-like chemotaxis protein